jgi:tetratricopeptide (TPR) repeat protein
MAREQYGEEHPRTAAALKEEGVVLMTLGQTDAGLAAYERALAIDRSVFGAGHHEVLRGAANRARILSAAGRHRECVAQAREVLGAVGGGEVPAVMEIARVNAHQALAYCLTDAGDLVAGERELRAAVTLVRPDLPAAEQGLEAIAYLGRNLLRQGRMAEAEEHLLDAWRRGAGTPARSVKLAGDLAELSRRLGRAEDAAGYERERAALEARPGPGGS